jgi:hypothetical protein
MASAAAFLSFPPEHPSKTKDAQRRSARRDFPLVIPFTNNLVAALFFMSNTIKRDRSKLRASCCALIAIETIASEGESVAKNSTPEQ